MNSTKGELKGPLYAAFEGAPKTLFQGALKVAQKAEERDTFDVVIDALLDSALEGVLEGAHKDALNNLCKDAQEATETSESNGVFCKYVQFSAFAYYVFPLNDASYLQDICGFKGEESKL